MATIAGLLAAAAPGTGADFSNDTLWLVVLKAIGIIVFLLLSVLFAIWFERKIVARMQLRPGPNVHGPFGLFQPLADAMKLLFKEDLMVHGVDKLIYVVAPMISAFCSLLVFAVIPFGPQVSMFGIRTPLQLTDLSVSVLYILAVTSLGVYGIVLGGWASRSTYPLLGAARSTAQLISYELVMGLSLVSVFILARSMSTSRIVESQTHVWWFLPLLPAFVLYLVAMVGETNRMPFDLPEAEGELVSGYMTEYSSMKFAWFFLAEYVNMLNVSAVATTLFLGGWRAPWPLSLVGDGVLNTGWWPVLWFLAKLWLLMFVFVWLRGTLVRFRYDQFMRFSWKVLIPVGLVWVVAVATEQAILRFADVEVRSVLIVLVVVVFAAAVLSSIAPKSAEGSRQRRRKRRFDAFAGGYPVPPRPGQYLPPSPRRARMGARPVQDVVSEQVEECEEESHG